MSSADNSAGKRAAHTRAVWPLVVLAALAISWWSLYVLAHDQYGMPRGLAAVVSTVYDGGALVLADLSQRYARSQDSGAAPRALMLALIGVSAWLNYRHATMLHYSLPGQVMFASPPVVAGALFEIEQRFEHKEALRAFGRVAPALPAFGRYAWMLHPARTTKRVWLITASRVDSVPITVMDIYPAPAGISDPAPKLATEDKAETDDDDILNSSEPPAWADMDKAAAVRRIDAILPDRSPKQVADLLTARGFEITPEYVRTARSRARAAARVAQSEVSGAGTIPLQRPVELVALNGTGR